MNRLERLSDRSEVANEREVDDLYRKKSIHQNRLLRFVLVRDILT